MSLGCLFLIWLLEWFSICGSRVVNICVEMVLRGYSHSGVSILKG